MIERSPLIGHLIPRYEEWWDILISSPWLVALALLFVLLSAQRHGELAYGSSRSSLLSWVVVAIYFASHLMVEVRVVNLALWGLLFMIMLSDGIISSLSHPRSPFMVYNLGLLLGLLFLVHPGSLLLYPFFIYKLRSIKSLSGRHVTALFLGSLTIVSLLTMLYAERSIAGVKTFLSDLVAPVTQIGLPELRVVPLLAIDLLFLIFVTIAANQSMQSSVVRVRDAMSYHLQLVWLLMLLHLLYGLQGVVSNAYILGIAFFGGMMSVHFMTQKGTCWVALPLGIIAVTTLILQLWTHHFQLPW